MLVCVPQAAEAQQQQLERALLVEQALVQQQQQTQEQLAQLQQTQQQLLHQHQQLLQQQQLLLQQQERQTIQQNIIADIPVPSNMGDAARGEASPGGHVTASSQQTNTLEYEPLQRPDGSRPLLQPHEQTLQHVINPHVQQAAHRPSLAHSLYEPPAQVRALTSPLIAAEACA
jgi:hypothetical protein